MRNLRSVVTIVVTIALFAGAAYAQPPLDGTYKSTLGEMLEGLQSTSWTAAGFHADPQPGQVLHAGSWNGSALAGEWEIVCPTVVSVSTVLDIPGLQKIVQITYVGGYVWLDGGGLWGGGDPSYTGIIDSYTEIRTMQLTGGYGTAENHSITAHIVGYPNSCTTFGIGNGTWIGDTDTGGATLPVFYPAFLDTNCDPIGNVGRWGTMTDLTMTITGCAVGAETQTWGAVKSRYKD